jgi:uncharacterized protein YfaT (DUF1175 family)
MTSQPEQPNLSRRRLLRAAAIAPAVAIPALAVGVASPAHAEYNGEITRSNVKLRAQNWYNRGIAYNGESYASDYEGGHTYRQDCSGFVSMCWHTAGSYSTRSLPSISREKPWENLKPGDIVNWVNPDETKPGHCMLFSAWSDPGVSFWVYHLESPTSDMEHEVKKIVDLKAADYVPRQYHNITAG